MPKFKIEDFDEMVNLKFNPPKPVKPAPSLTDLKRRAVLKGIRPRLKLPSRPGLSRAEPRGSSQVK